ncbi:hypothetical protein AA313_de0208658 [Arthrobotrys entomopaga]|nr:hypothetical protein AA313_de0208658 [Arthrobotrys entomopaga]
MPTTTTQPPTPSLAGPVFSAITSSTRHIYLLLRCIGFMPTANVSISADNIRFSVEDSHSMQANVCLTPDLFSSYNYTPTTLHEETDAPPPSSAERFNLESEDDGVRFQISLSALLECLQIFGADANNKEKQFGGGGGSGANRDGMAFGRPAAISVTTTCHLTTFITPPTYDLIPFSRSTMTHKIILKAAYLHDALQELDTLSPETLTYSTSPSKPHFSLTATGILSQATVDFSHNKNIMETFSVTVENCNRYKFGLVRKAMRAMGVASKVSLRGDEMGVLSMQYLIEMPEKGGAPTFIDFRFLPLNEGGSSDENDDGGSGESDDEGEGEGDEGEEMML